MISRKDLSELLARQTVSDSPVLSVYLAVDLSQAVNLNRGFESALKSALNGLAARLKKKDPQSYENGFAEDARNVLSFVSQYNPKGKSLVIFCDASEDFLWSRDISVELPTQVHWTDAPYIRPVLEVRDEFERCGIILTDRGKARLFTFFMGEVTEHVRALAEEDIRQFDAAGKDQMRSQMRFQRKSDEHAHSHLKNVAAIMDRLSDEHRFERLVLAGPTRAASDLKSFLSDRLQKAVIGTIPLSIEADEKQILREVQQLERLVERAGEEQLVEALITAASKNGQAVLGVDSTLKAVQEGRIRRLVYADGVKPPGSNCLKCNALLVEMERPECPYCNGPLQKTEDLIGEVVRRVVDNGGQVEQVRAKAADDLKDISDGIGAFLRF